MKRQTALLVSAGLAVALGAFAAPGCGTPPEQPLLARPGEPVNVIVELDKATGKVVVSNETIYLRVGKDWAQWISPDGVVDIEFKSGGVSPFAEMPQHVSNNRVLRSRPPKLGSENKTYGYKVILTLDSDGSKHELDPRIEVMP